MATNVSLSVDGGVYMCSLSFSLNMMPLLCFPRLCECEDLSVYMCYVAFSLNVDWFTPPPPSGDGAAHRRRLRERDAEPGGPRQAGL